MAATAAACGGVPDEVATRRASNGSSGVSNSGGTQSAGGQSAGGSSNAGGSGGVASASGMAGTIGGSSPFGGTSAFGSAGMGGTSVIGAFGGSSGFGGTASGGASGHGGAGGRGGAPGSVCTSKKNWTSGNGQDMRPGADCTSCHAFAVAGTVYPTLNEPTNCDGTGAAGVKVVITGANGTALTLTPSATSGNFYSNTKVSTPYSVKLTNSAGATRSMTAHQTAGNCNSCHTPSGTNGAPGRIMAP